MTIKELLDKVTFAGYLRIVENEHFDKLLVTSCAEALNVCEIDETILNRRVCYIQPRSDKQSDLFSIPVTEIVVF